MGLFQLARSPCSPLHAQPEAAPSNAARPCHARPTQTLQRLHLTGNEVPPPHPGPQVTLDVLSLRSLCCSHLASWPLPYIPAQSCLWPLHLASPLPEPLSSHVGNKWNPVCSAVLLVSRCPTTDLKEWRRVQTRADSLNTLGHAAQHTRSWRHADTPGRYTQTGTTDAKSRKPAQTHHYGVQDMRGHTQRQC